MEWGIRRLDGNVGVHVIGVPKDVYAFYGATEKYIATPGKVDALVLCPEAGGPWRLRLGDCVARSLTAATAADDTFTCTDHGYVTGMGPYKLSGTTLPAGPTTTALYWVRVPVDGNGDPITNKFQLAESYEDAINGEVVDLTTAGTPNSWKLGGLAVTPPGANITDGYSSLKVVAVADAKDQRIPLAAPMPGFTVVGTGGTDVLTYYYL